MADARPPALPFQTTPSIPQASQQPTQPVQQSIAPDQPVPTQPVQHIPQLIWSHFKSEFSGKPEEEAEAHLLRRNDWMDTHQFQEGMKV